MAETLAQVLRRATEALRGLGIESAGLDARLLLQAATGLSHADIVAEPGQQLNAAQLQAFTLLMDRRLKFEPVSRILGSREFYGREFRVTPAVLDPRPDTEVLVDAVLQWGRSHPVRRLLDLGTGSGILALTLLAEWPEAEAVAVDLSPDALAVASSNAAALGLEERVQFQVSDWFEAVEGSFDLIISNPPYIARAEVSGLAPDVRNFDPHLALVGGEEGVEPYGLIAAGAKAALESGGALFVEIGAGQAKIVMESIISKGFNSLSEHVDLAGHVRTLGFCLR